MKIKYNGDYIFKMLKRIKEKSIQHEKKVYGKIRIWTFYSQIKNEMKSYFIINMKCCDKK
jgi:C-terminal processing protease CtpA/Prc